ncbi:M15 family metallopeptidase [Paenibacillus qinlingensis]|uniref:D-alanyl-D-alanine carboxypeptidase n=1 Tax=Paenibacillus qinlingensis TaxID=1837343 RepID=A0ABU1NRI5_9BACL|nr:M15 family metallopeptidase [Paenibacillus qinlingensis]MDR6549964.1 D-alanyl-D-alanine carboxypeptidase [Paenibacillus qinlingensis]
MKKWVFWFVIVALLGYEAYQQHKAPREKVEQSQVVNTAYAATSPGKGLTIKVTKDQIYQGSLVLINNDYPIHSGGMQPDILNLFENKELVKGFGILDNTVRLSRTVVESFTTMIQAAAKDGVRHFMINSGYRDNKEQSQLYKDMGANYALPAGHSEHNLGLGLDIGSTQGEMSQSDEGEWLIRNAADYGFILRYPKDKTAITGIQFEPWHFRYVGLPHSVIMKQMNLSLEEYLAYLKQQKNITTKVKGKIYEISYHPITQNSTIQVPNNRSYTLSGNNMDGIIVTVLP